MFSFSNFMKSEFGDSPAPTTLPLEPRLKIGQDDGIAPPVYFVTPGGERRVPREKDPRKPTYEMIKDARHGILSDFLRSGIIFRASDFVGIVNPKTAVITLDDIYDFETRCLTAIDDTPLSRPPLSSRVSVKKIANKEADDEKTLRNLFYISLFKDELPSFHFWTKPGDVDPVTVGESIDWGKVLEPTLASPATTVKLAKPEKNWKEKEQEKGRYGAEEQQNSETKPSQGHLAGDAHPVPDKIISPILVHSPLEAKVLLEFNRGGMYLRDFTHKSLYAMACWLIKNEDGNEEDEAKHDEADVRDMFLDILEPGMMLHEEKIVSVSRASNRNFEENVKPFLGRPDYKFWVRSPKHQPLWDINSGKYDLRLVRPNVGYCYCSADWHIAEKLGLNSWRFEKALEFLFDWELSAHPNSKRLNLDIPSYGSFDLYRSGVVVDAKIQNIFAELSKTPVSSDSGRATIFIRDIVEDDTDGSESLGASFPWQSNVEKGKSPQNVPNEYQTTSGADQRIEQEPKNASNIPYQPSSALFDSFIIGQPNDQLLNKATGVSEAPKAPSIHPRAFSMSEIDNLQKRLRIAEASAIETDDLQERLSIAEEKLSEMNGLKERLKTSENRARLQSSCPFCSQNWAGATRQQQQDHLRLHQKRIVHQPASQKCPHPDCSSWLGEGQIESTYEAISKHLRLHIEEEHAEDGICEYRHCHTNMYAFTAQQQEEHDSMHRDNEETSKECGQLLQEVKDLEDTVTERNRLRQQVTHLQDSISERDQMQRSLINITEERDELQNQILELEGRLKAASGRDKGMRTKGLEKGTEKEGFVEPSRTEAPRRLRYCNICLKSVDRLGVEAKVKHADKCETSEPEFLLFTPTEAKTERDRRKNKSDFIKRQAAKEEEDGTQVSNTGKKRKQKTSAETSVEYSQPDTVGEASTVEQPESSKTAGRKSVKRKTDTFKPSKEDGSEDEEDKPIRKKAKLKGKETETERKTAPTRRSTRIKSIGQPPKEKEDQEKEAEEAYDESLSSAKGGKRMNKGAAVITVSKKAKTKK